VIEIIDFQNSHFDLMEKRKIFESDVGLKDRILEAAHGESSYAFSLINKNRIMAIVTATEIWSGVFDITTVTSKHLGDCKFSFHKAILKLIKRADDMKARRLQFLVKSSFVVGCEWAKRLGFEREGLLRKYGPENCYCSRSTRSVYWIQKWFKRMNPGSLTR